MTRTEISGLFHGHRKKGDVERALSRLDRTDAERQGMRQVLATFGEYGLKE